MPIPSYERRSFSETAVATTLSSGITDTDTSISIASSTGWPSGSAGDFYIRIESEDIRIDTRSGTTLTVLASGRGANGTTAASHASGVAVTLVFTSFDADEANYVVTKTVGAVTAIGDLLYADAANSLTRLAKGTSGYFLKQGASTPSWAAVASTDLSDFTEAVQDVVGAFATQGSNITITYSDVGNTLTFAVSGLASTNLSDFTEAVQDVVGALGLGGSGLTFTYTDGSNTAVIDLNVDGSTVEVNADTLRVKALGIAASHLAADAVTTAKILDANVTAAKLASDAVTTVKILDANVTNAKIASEAWTSWTPTIGGGWALGNGTVSGHYLKRGREVQIKGTFTVGSSTTKSGDLQISNLPYAPVNHAAILGISFYDLSATTDYPGILRIATSATSGSVNYTGVGSVPSSAFNSIISSAQPFTWATGDMVELWGTYETAS